MPEQSQASHDGWVLQPGHVLPGAATALGDSPLQSSEFLSLSPLYKSYEVIIYGMYYWIYIFLIYRGFLIGSCVTRFKMPWPCERNQRLQTVEVSSQRNLSSHAWKEFDVTLSNDKKWSRDNNRLLFRQGSVREVECCEHLDYEGKYLAARAIRTKAHDTTP